MKKLLTLSILLAAFIVGFPAIKPSLSSYIIEKQLTSDSEVQRILAESNNPADSSGEPIFNNVSVPYIVDKNELLAQIQEIVDSEDNQVLGTNDERWIEIDLSDQRVYGWEGSNQVFNFLVSTGKWGATPTGTYKVWIKLASTKMSGGSKALGTYYYLPNVPCVMYFYKGYGLHGTYWHNNFGTPMSHGCVNLRTDDACALFNWASVGTRVTIHQ